MGTILGIAGQKQSGKSSSCDFIKSIEISLVRTYSFADPLKLFCVDVLGLTYKQCYGTDEDKNSLTPWQWEDIGEQYHKKFGRHRGNMTAREVMQIQGEIQRDCFSKGIWVNCVFRKIRKEENNRCLRSFQNILHIISDLRYQNEVERCLNEGGYVIHLKKRTNDNSASSEAELLTIDWSSYDNVFEIDNTNMTIHEKNAEIAKIIDKILNRK